MKLIADVDVVNRLLPAVNVKSQSRPRRSQLCVGRKGSKHHVELLVSSQGNCAGTSYTLQGNVAAVFTKFVHEGKCTIRLHEPPVDLCLSKADAIHLKGFVNVLKAASSGSLDVDNVVTSQLRGLTSRQAASRLRTKLVITSRATYPLTTSFPAGLDSLTVQHCALRIVDPRVMTLSRLLTLDVSHNHIATLPADWSGLPALSALTLADNRLTELPATMMSGSLQSTLTQLDLSDNALTVLDRSVYRLRALVVLQLDRNRLEMLPSGVSRLGQLRQLSLSANLLHSLPGDICRLRALDTLDLSHNPLSGHSTPSGNRPVSNTPGSSVSQSDDAVADVCDVLTMFELAARAVLNQRVRYTSADIGRRLAVLLDSAECCSVCGLWVVTPYTRLVSQLDLRRLCVTAVNSLHSSTVPTHCAVCSRHCATRLTTSR